MSLTADSPVVFEDADPPVFNDHLVLSSTTIYAGNAVGICPNALNAAVGYARKWVLGDEFVGFATEKCDNSSGSSGDKRVHVRSNGIAKLAVTGASAVTHVDDAVYMTDAVTFTLTGSANQLLGYVHRWVVSTTCMVKFLCKSFRF